MARKIFFGRGKKDKKTVRNGNGAGNSNSRHNDHLDNNIHDHPAPVDEPTDRTIIQIDIEDEHEIDQELNDFEQFISERMASFDVNRRIARHRSLNSNVELIERSREEISNGGNVNERKVRSRDNVGSDTQWNENRAELGKNLMAPTDVEKKVNLSAMLDKN